MDITFLLLDLFAHPEQLHKLLLEPIDESVQIKILKLIGISRNLIYEFASRVACFWEVIFLNNLAVRFDGDVTLPTCLLFPLMLILRVSKIHNALAIGREGHQRDNDNSDQTTVHVSL